jgi:hypothetical protein
MTLTHAPGDEDPSPNAYFGRQFYGRCGPDGGCRTYTSVRLFRSTAGRCA